MIESIFFFANFFDELTICLNTHHLLSGHMFLYSSRFVCWKFMTFCSCNELGVEVGRLQSPVHRQTFCAHI